MIEFEHLTRGFTSGTTAVSDLSMQVEEGETTAM